MAWHLAISDMPGRPYAVIDGHGQLAGCHSTRALAVMQMTQLNMDGIEVVEGAEVPAPVGVTPSEEVKTSVPWVAPPIAYTTPRTVAW